MNRKKKSAIVVAVIVIFAFAVLIGVRLYSNHTMPSDWLGTRLYQGDRIKCCINIEVDGETARVVKNDKSKYTFKETKKGFVISHRANDYDSYQYNLLVNDSIPLNITAHHFNWWEITNSDVYLSIDTKEKRYTISEYYCYTDENPSYVYSIKSVQEDERQYDYTDSIEFNIGPKG